MIRFSALLTVAAMAMLVAGVFSASLGLIYAAIAASILAAHGFDAHPVVNGGIDSWVAAGKPTVEFRRCGG